MTDDLLEALRPLVARLEGFLATRPDLRQEVAAAARAVADRLAPPSPPAAVPEPRVETPPPVPVEPPPARPFPPAVETPPAVPVPAADDRRLVEPQSPGVIAARCRVKADAAKLVADRLGDGASAGGTPLAADLIARAAELPDCFLWMLNPGSHTYSDSRAGWLDLAGAFQAAAAAADMLRTWLELPAEEGDPYAGDVLHLAAEAQSVLLSAAVGVGRLGYDQDQLELFVTVREEAKDREVFVRRYLRKEDRADPAAAPELARRVGELTTTVRDRTARAAGRRKMLNNLRYKLTRMRDDPAGQAGEWPRVVELIDRLVADGLPPSNADLRGLLVPVIDRLPADVELPPTVGFVLREIGRYLDSRPDEDETPDDAPSPEVQEVAQLIGGRELVLIGGQARPNHKAALIRAFDLANLDWIVTPEHESYTVFEPAVRRPETAVVLLAIRWSSHSYAEVQQYCTEYGKPLVRLPAGYNANQVAHQILTQVGDRLRAAGAPA